MVQTTVNIISSMQLALLFTHLYIIWELHSVSETVRNIQQLIYHQLFNGDVDKHHFENGEAYEEK